jgi:hypothetical protein
MRNLAFIILVAVAMVAPIAATVILIKLATDLAGSQLALAIVLATPTLFASLLSGAWVGEKLKELL